MVQNPEFLQFHGFPLNMSKLIDFIINYLLPVGKNFQAAGGPENAKRDQPSSYRTVCRATSLSGVSQAYAAGHIAGVYRYAK
jgi:hypothetical protein